MQNKTPAPILSILLFAVGVLIGLAIAILATWPDFEASSYQFARNTNTPLNGLRCPIILNRDETGTVSLTVSNTTDKLLTPSVKTQISTSDDPISFLEPLRLASGQAKKLEWRIGPENIDLHYFIFVKALVYASYPIPNREATCGTFIMDLPLGGTIFLILMVTLSLTSMGSGLYILNRINQSPERAEMNLRPMYFLAVLIVLALIVSFMGWWIQSIVVIVMAVLTAVVLLNLILK
ncbi:MAG: hypothetical protein M3R47_12285 [Chloroflexota bacterium]|nr:hypothetical protein [Chloroflexota bacterium]